MKIVASAHPLTIANRLSEITRVHPWLKASFEQLGLSDETFFSFDLSAEEIVTNLISYAYEDDAEHQIVLRLSQDDSAICLEIEDDGTPFNPLEYPKFNQPNSIEEAKIGGLGILLVRHHIDTGDYVRREGRNVLMLKILKK